MISSDKADSNVSSKVSSSSYDGLIGVPLYKRLLDSTLCLFAFIDQNVACMPLLHHVMGFFRCVQLVGPSFCVPYFTRTLKTPVGIVLSIFSVLFHLLPSQVQPQIHVILLAVIDCLYFFFFLIVLIAAYIFRNQNHVHLFLIYFIHIFRHTVGLFMMPVMLEAAGELISPNLNGFPTLPIIMLLLITFLVLILNVFFSVFIFKVGLLFTSNSLPSIEQLPQSLLLFFTLATTFLLAVGSKLQGIAHYLIPFISSLFYLCLSILIAVDYIGTGFLRARDKVCVLALSFFGFLNTVALGFLIAFETLPNELTILCQIAAFFLILFLSSTFTFSQQKRHMVQLDELEFEDADFLDIIKSPMMFAHFTNIGFGYSHPYAIDFKIFRHAADIWPRNFQVCFIFAKFLALCPDKTYELKNVSNSFIDTSIRGCSAINEINMIVRRRETELSSTLKRSIEKIHKEVSLAKRRLRQFWDLVLAGNIGEMEEQIVKTRETMKEAENKMDQLQILYPNNRFVSRLRKNYYQSVSNDTKKTQEEYNQLHLLQRGIMVKIDIAHDLALLAFPNLPSNFGKALISQTQPSADSMNFTDGQTDENSTFVDIQQQSTDVLEFTIQNLKIPSVRFIYFSYLFLFFLCFLIPSIVTIAISPWYTKNLLTPLHFINSLGLIRLYIPYQVTFFQRYYGEITTMTDGSPIFPQVAIKNLPLLIFNGSIDPLVHLRYSRERVFAYTQSFLPFADYSHKDPHMDKIRSDFFTTTTDVDVWTTPTDSKKTPMNCFDLIAFMANQMADLVTAPSLSSIQYLNIFNNFERAVAIITHSMDLFHSYLESKYESVTVLATIIQIFASILVCIIYIGVFYYSRKKLVQNKTAIYSAITTLPKSVISSIIDSLKPVSKSEALSDVSLHSGEGDSISKQEENILRILASANDSFSKKGLTVFLAVFTLFLGILFILVDEKISTLFTKQWREMIFNGPQYDLILGCPSYLSCSWNYFFALYYNKQGNTVGHPNSALQNYQERFEYNSEQTKSYFSQMRFGGPLKTEFPFQNIDAGITDLEDYFKCWDPTVPPKTLVDIYACWEGDLQVFMIEGLMKKFWYPIFDGKVAANTRDTKLNQFYFFSVLVFLDAFFSPMVSRVTPATQKSLINTQESTIFPIYFICAFALVFTVLTLFVAKKEDQYFRYTLSLLKIVFPDTLHTGNKISRILNGNFNTNYRISSGIDQEAYAEIIQALPDPVLIVDSKQTTILSRNSSAEHFFGDSDYAELGLNLPIGHHKFTFQQYFFNLHIFTCPQQNRIYIFRDQTVSLNYKALIEEERNKTDVLLGSILPPNLITRVQNGEQNISFSVASASIVFIDIVEFTPWCSVNTASFVMKTLNQLFSHFDSLIAQLESMIRVKCIGDCFMAAGGIFQTVNRPDQHSREAVEFGLEAINVVKLMAKDGFQKQIRVGINTGGPIVAGVLGQAKPTFEILGKPINLAQQMEHHGVPMKVHISRSVYELIYGTGFNVIERGMTETNSGKVLTYIIEGKISS